MANRRMFSKSVTETDSFYDMPATARALYLHLNMNADDDGVVDSPKRIMRASAASEDDIKVLIAKGYIIPFNSGIVIVRHWKQANSIQRDRYHKTVHQAEYGQLKIAPTGEYILMDGSPSLCALPAHSVDVSNVDTTCIQDVSNMETEVRLGEVSLGKASNTLSGKPDSTTAVREIVDYLNEKTGKHFRPSTQATARHIQARLNEGFSVDDFKAVIDNTAARWGNDPNMCRYLRPETLFGSKFEGYLNEGGARYDYSAYDC